jgi:hypothetical protein
MSMQALSEVFGNRIISSGIWPRHSPDLNPCDFFCWDCLKDKVYSSNPRKEEELMGNIRKETANIPAYQLQKVDKNLFRRHEECILIERQHFQHVLWFVNCNYFIPNVVGQQTYLFINKIRMQFATGNAPVAVSRSAKLRTSLYYCNNSYDMRHKRVAANFEPLSSLKGKRLHA